MCICEPVQLFLWWCSKNINLACAFLCALGDPQKNKIQGIMAPKVHCMAINRGVVYLTVQASGNEEDHVLVMDMEGNELNQWRHGFRSIFGITSDSSVVFVSDDGRIQACRLDGSKLYEMYGPKPDGFFAIGMTVGRDKLYASANDFVYAFALHTKEQELPPLEFEILHPDSSVLAVVGTELFVGGGIDESNWSGCMYDANNGTMLRNFTGLDNVSLPLYGATTSAVGELCLLYYNGTLQCTKPDGTTSFTSSFRQQFASDLRDLAWHENKLFGIDVSGKLHLLH